MAVRSKQQLAFLLKLIEVNNVCLTRKNLSIRQKFWQAITQKLNQMEGAEKDVDGWKRTYHTWRLNVGNNYKKELQKIINDLPEDEYFVISIDEDEGECDVDESTKSATNPTENQRHRLHELICKHRELLSSSADDEPLKARIWLNVAEELNAIPGALRLTPKEWQKCVDWQKYKVRRGRKPKKRVAETGLELHQAKRLNAMTSSCRQDVASIKVELLDEMDLEQEEAAAACDTKYENLEQLFVEESETNHTKGMHTDGADNNYVDQDEESRNEYIDILHNDIDDLDDYVNEDLGDEFSDIDEVTVIEACTTNMKPIKPSPIVNSFRYSQRLTNSVEKLSKNVCDIKDLLQKTSNTLNSVEHGLQQQLKQQEETNTLLKRNGQLLKMLIQCRNGRHSSNATN